MKESKSLKEVWIWKETVYEKTKNMNKSELLKYFNASIDNFLLETGYKRVEISKGVYRLEKGESKIITY